MVTYIMYVPRFSIPRPSLIYPNCDFWFEKKPSGNPGPGKNTHQIEVKRLQEIEQLGIK
jgi:hypothetical protein